MTIKENEIHTPIIVDLETKRGFRVISYVAFPGEFHSAIQKILKNKDIVHRIVQIVNPLDGETIKGPKYDTTEQNVKGRNISNLLGGVKQRPPIEPSQSEPRDRFQENKSMIMTKDKFQRLVKEALSELREQKRSPRERLKESLRPMVEQVLGEIANIKIKQIDDEKEEKQKVQKGYDFARQALYQNDGSTQRLDIPNNEKEEEMRKIVEDKFKEFDVYWDDHNDLVVNGQNLIKIRIVPKFENNFDIDAYFKLVDRVRAIGLTWDQVKAFVKVNLETLKGAEGNKTIADRRREHALANRVDQTKGKDAGPRWDVIKNRGEKDNGQDAKLKTTKKKDMDYKENAVTKEEDFPDQPMKDVTKAGEDPKGKNHNIEKTSKVKPPKHENDKALRPTDKKTPKFRTRKSQ